MAENNWNEGVANLETLAAQFPTIERKALRAVVNVIQPRLKEAAPIRVSMQQGGNSLPNGAFRAACRGSVHIGKGDGDPSQAIVDFGKITWIANIVDSGHRAPHARALTRSGHPVTGKPTPAHPFVRSVQDSSAAAAQDAYEAAMTAEIEKALQGN